MGVSTVQDIILQDQYIGDDEPVTIICKVASGDDRGEPYVPTAATALVYDPLRDDEISGTATAAGTTTSFTSTDLIGLGADFLKGMPCKVTRGSDATQFAETMITAYVTATGVLTLETLPWAVAVDDTLEVLGYPLITETDVTANIGGDDGNEVFINTTGSDAHSYTRKDRTTNGIRVALFYCTFSATRSDLCRATYNVLPR